VGTAFGGGSIEASPDTGLSQGSSVTVTGSGFTPLSIGNVLECNNTQNQPTVKLPAPVSNTVPVGCIPPSFNHIIAVKSDGSVSGTFAVSQGTIGPPCGTSEAVIKTCPATDSAGKKPAADAAKYPCPPTAAQLAAGDTCVLTYGDQANESSSIPIHFAAEGSSSAATPTTAPTTVPATATTVPATAPTTAASSGPLATTGPGTGLHALTVAGATLLVAGLALVGLQARTRRARRQLGRS